MLARTTFAALALAASVSANAAPELVALNESKADASYMNLSSIRQDGDIVDVTVLRMFDQTVRPGDDAKPAAPAAQHQSVKAVYSVNCATGKLALIEWTMFEGMFATGGVIWSDKARFNHFTPAADAESRELIGSVCTTKTAGR